MALARDLLPLRLVDGGKTRVAVGLRMHLGDLQPVRERHPLRIDFRAADHGDFGGRTPQRIAARDRERRLDRGRDARRRLRGNRDRA